MRTIPTVLAALTNVRLAVARAPASAAPIAHPQTSATSPVGVSRSRSGLTPLLALASLMRDNSERTVVQNLAEH